MARFTESHSNKIEMKFYHQYEKDLLKDLLLKNDLRKNYVAPLYGAVYSTIACNNDLHQQCLLYIHKYHITSHVIYNTQK